MIKIVSFAHYTCGGLLCDMLNQTFSPLAANGGIASIQHNIGKIGDADSVMENFDQQQFLQHVQKANTTHWVGTHCWLGNVDLDSVDQVINVTTETYRSRLLRWIRAYQLYYLDSVPWRGLTGMQQIDKQRETAKNYLKPFKRIDHSRVINLEFADVVDHAPTLQAVVTGDIESHVQRWQQANYFLFDQNLWTSTAATRFYEAEYEVAVGQAYTYE